MKKIVIVREPVADSLAGSQLNVMLKMLLPDCGIEIVENPQEPSLDKAHHINGTRCNSAASLGQYSNEMENSAEDLEAGTTAS